MKTFDDIKCYNIALAHKQGIDPFSPIQIDDYLRHGLKLMRHFGVSKKMSLPALIYISKTHIYHTTYYS